MAPLRQASLQNFTSSQFFAQRLRQVIGRPHATQGLLGSDVLLPLNEGGVEVMAKDSVATPRCRRAPMLAPPRSDRRRRGSAAPYNSPSKPKAAAPTTPETPCPVSRDALTQTCALGAGTLASSIGGIAAPACERTVTGRIDLTGAPVVLGTSRLRLETPRAEHAGAFAEGVAATMPALTYVVWGLHPRDVEWARQFCEDDARSVASGEDLVFHVFEIADGGWVGRIDIHTIDFKAARGEIGYVGDMRRAGRGLMREAALAVIGLCFELGFERIEAMSDARNARALHFAATLGMQREGLLRHHERDPRGEFCDMVLYATVRGDHFASASTSGS